MAAPRWEPWGPHIQAAFISLRFHLMGKNILGASDLTLAIAIRGVAFHPLAAEGRALTENTSGRARQRLLLLAEDLSCPGRN